MISARRFNKIRALAKERRTGKPVAMRYFARKLSNDDFIREFCVLNGSCDPSMFVESECADGTLQRWPRYEEDGRSVFVAPDGYLGGPIAWVHDKDLVVEAMTYESDKTFSF